MAENLYSRAANLWVARRLNLDTEKVSNVNFKVIYGGYCETCGYETFGLEYYYNGKYQELELGTTSAGKFIQEAVELLKEFE